MSNQDRVFNWGRLYVMEDLNGLFTSKSDDDVAGAFAVPDEYGKGERLNYEQVWYSRRQKC